MMRKIKAIEKQREIEIRNLRDKIRSLEKDRDEKITAIKEDNDIKLAKQVADHDEQIKFVKRQREIDVQNHRQEIAALEKNRDEKLGKQRVDHGTKIYQLQREHAAYRESLLNRLKLEHNEQLKQVALLANANCNMYYYNVH